MIRVQNNNNIFFRCLLSASLASYVFAGYSQDPISQFDLQTPICLSENLLLNNTSENSETYLWDFCANEFLNSPEINDVQTISGLSQSHGINIFEDAGKKIGFVTDRTGNKLFRIVFTDSLVGSATYEQVILPGGTLLNPVGFTALEDDSGNWFAFIGTNNNTHGIVKLEFGNSLLNTPVASNVGTFGEGSQIRDLKLVEDNGKFLMLLLNVLEERFTILDFDRDLSTNPIDTIQQPSFPSIVNATGFSLVKDVDSWYAYVVSIDGNDMSRIYFGSSLTNVPVKEIEYTLAGFSRPYMIQVIDSKQGGYYALVSNLDDSLMLVDLKDLASPPEVVPYSFFSNAYGVWGGYNNGDFSFFSMSGSKLKRITFDGMDCGASMGQSMAEFPENITYKNAGDHPIRLQAFFGNKKDSFVDTVTVNSSEAPDIDFLIDANRCTSSQNSFTSVSSMPEEIIGYQWIFGEDTLGMSSNSDTVYQFTNPGPYDVYLIITSASGCSNQVMKTVNIYDSPGEPDFSIEGTKCSGTSFTFSSNFDLSSYPDSILTYSWNFNGEGFSSDVSPNFSFDTPGSKQIVFEVSIPGCTVQIDSTIILGEGALVDFSWTNNCFGEEVTFINSTVGENITSFSWDFGDGSEIVMEQDPQHTFNEADTFQILLSVVNDLGCVSALSKELIVRSGGLVGVDFTSPIENIPVLFNGIDSTQVNDSIVSWQWDFDGLSNAQEQSPEFTFAEPGSYLVGVSIETEQGCSDTAMVEVLVAESENAIALFNSIDSACLTENIVFDNISSNANSYEWDFCGGEFENSPVIEDANQIAGLSQSHGISIYDDNGVKKALITDKNGDKIYLAIFENSLSGNVTISQIQVPAGTFNDPTDVKAIQDHTGNWTAFVATNNASHGIVKLFFGSSLSNVPEANNIGTFGEGNNSLRSLDIIEENGEYLLIYLNTSLERFGLVNYGSDLSGPPQDTTHWASFPSLLNATGFSLVKKDGDWFGYLVSIDGNDMLKVYFGNSLQNEPIPMNEYTFPEFARPLYVDIVPAGEKYYALVSNLNDSLVFIDLDDLSNDPQTLNIPLFSNAYAVWGSYDNGDFVFFSITGTTLKRIIFSGDSCGESISSSTLTNPKNIRYNNQGDHTVRLISYHENGNFDVYTKTITVSSSTAPDIAFSISSNQCLSNTNTFTSTNTSGNITAYSWDFDGDGVEDSADPNPTYQFAEAGTYEVRLSVESDEGCGNFVQESISIYPEPPVPVFTVPKDSFCVGEPVIISNLTDDTAWDGIVGYTWSVTDLTDTTTAAPELTFAQPGEKIIRVISQIPGCESIEVTDTIQVIESPVVDFIADPVCDGETTIFNNNSEAGMILWDFGDGNTSTDQNPTHTFATPNTYSVSLSVTNDLECTTTLVKEVAVNAIPQANFQYDLVCAGSESAFEDMSVVEQADISAWQWFVDGELVSEEQFPVIAFPEARDFTVRLISGSTKGCESFYEEVVAVGAAPNTGIGIDLGCLGEPTVFSDLTDPVEVLTRSWMIDGKPYSTAAPAVTFNEPGTYEVELTVTNNQLCSSIVTETFTIYELPVADFTISGQCNNEIILLEDASTSTSDPISVRQWYIDGSLLGEGANVSLSGYPPGNYDFTLEVTTENGCVVSTQQTFEIAETPEASFTASNDYGVPPFRLDFSNTSQMASVNEWYVNDALITTNPSPSIVFNDSGSQLVRLITYNSTGCADTAEMIINAIEPVVDLAVTSVQLVEDGNNYDIVLDVKNASNLPIEAMSVNVELQNQFSVSEQVYQRINSGEESIVMLGTSIPKSTNGPAYLCISIFSAYEESAANLKDNEACITIEQKISFEPPYPNPASSETSLRYILPEGGDATIEVFDVSGSIEISENYEDLPKGLNQFILDVSTLDAGTYLIKFRYNGSVIVSKIIKL